MHLEYILHMNTKLYNTENFNANTSRSQPSRTYTHRLLHRMIFISTDETAHLRSHASVTQRVWPLR